MLLLPRMSRRISALLSLILCTQGLIELARASDEQRRYFMSGNGSSYYALMTDDSKRATLEFAFVDLG